MEFPGGWNALALSEPRPIKQIIAAAEIYDGVATHQGVIQLSDTYFAPSGGTWTSCPFALDGEPVKLTALYKLTDEEQKELIPYGVNASSNRRLTINVPKDRMVNVVFWIYFPCGACCYRFNDPTLGPDMNKRRVLRRVFAFNPIQRNDEQKRWEFGITAIEASRINGEEWDKLLPCENCY